MRTTLLIDETLLEDAKKASGLPTRTAVIERGLRLVVAEAARRRLAAIRGTVPGASAPGRRRPSARKAR